MTTTLHRPLALLSLAVLLSACAAVSPGAHYAAPAAGTSYVSERHDSGSYGNGTFDAPGKVVAREWNGQPVVGFENAQSTLLVSREGAYLGVTAPDGKTVMSWEPAPAHFPIGVGKSWTEHYKLKLHNPDRDVPFDTTGTVEAYEMVAVPAGRFMAFRMRSHDTLGNENVEWYAPELGMLVKTSQRRTDRNAAGAGTRETQIKSYTRPGS